MGVDQPRGDETVGRIDDAVGLWLGARPPDV